MRNATRNPMGKPLSSASNAQFDEQSNWKAGERIASEIPRVIRRARSPVFTTRCPIRAAAQLVRPTFGVSHSRLASWPVDTPQIPFTASASLRADGTYGVASDNMTMQYSCSYYLHCTALDSLANSAPCRNFASNRVIASHPPWSSSVCHVARFIPRCSPPHTSDETRRALNDHAGYV
jgi:hypothetical protein